MELLVAKVVASALLEYAAGELSADWFERQTFVNLDFSRILPRVKNPVVQLRLMALLNE